MHLGYLVLNGIVQKPWPLFIWFILILNLSPYDSYKIFKIKEETMNSL